MSTYRDTSQTIPARRVNTNTDTITNTNANTNTNPDTRRIGNGDTSMSMSTAIPKAAYDDFSNLRTLSYSH